MRLLIKQSGMHRGEKLYTISTGEDPLFTGTLDEVKRFLAIHNGKVRERRRQVEAAEAALRAG